MAQMRLLYLGNGNQRYILSDVDDVNTAPAPPVFMIPRLPDMMRRPSVGGHQKAVLVAKDKESARVGRLLLS